MSSGTVPEVMEGVFFNNNCPISNKSSWEVIKDCTLGRVKSKKSEQTYLRIKLFFNTSLLVKCIKVYRVSFKNI